MKDAEFSIWVSPFFFALFLFGWNLEQSQIKLSKWRKINLTSKNIDVQTVCQSLKCMDEHV